MELCILILAAVAVVTFFRWGKRRVAVLSDREIKEEIKRGNIIFFDPDRSPEELANNIGNCSVDVTLGENYFRNTKKLIVFNPWCREHCQDYWGIPQKAEVITAFDVEYGIAASYGLKEGDRYIFLAPGETILGHTVEFIGGRNFITTKMQTRSSAGRCNITVCRCAGQGDIGYTTRWTLEITNNSPYNMILLVGARVAQIVFYYSGVPERSYTARGKYQSDNEITDVVSKWQPEMMLPRLYLDAEGGRP